MITVDKLLDMQVVKLVLTVDNLLDLRVNRTADKILTILNPVVRK